MTTAPRGLGLLALIGPFLALSILPQLPRALPGSRLDDARGVAVTLGQRFTVRGVVIDLEWDGADRLVVISSLGWGLWDCTRSQMLIWHGPHPATARVAYSRTKRLLAFADGPRVEVYSTLHPDRVVAAITRAADVTQIDFSERGDLLAVGDTDGVVELLDPRTLSTISKAAL